MKPILKPTLLALALSPALALANGATAAADSATAGYEMHGDKDMHGDKHGDKHLAGKPMSDQEFLNQSYATGRKEVLAARLAQNHATEAQVRLFAAKVEEDRRSLNQRLDKAGAGVIPPHPRDAAVGDHVARNVEGPADTHPSVPPDEMTDDYVRSELQTFPRMRPLLDAEGEAFDRKYVDLQLKMHRESIARFEAVANSTRNSAEVREIAKEALPNMRFHLSQAETLARMLEPDRQAMR